MNTFSNSQLDCQNLTGIDDIVFSDLHPNHAKVVMIASAIVPCILAIALSVFIVLLPKVTMPLIGYLIMIILIFGLLALRYRAAKTHQFALREQDILFRGGLFWHKTTAVAFNRIQHIDLTHGPLDRKYGISTLKFFTAGGSSVDLAIPGLPSADAEKLRVFVLQKITQQPSVGEIVGGTNE